MNYGCRGLRGRYNEKNKEVFDFFLHVILPCTATYPVFWGRRTLRHWVSLRTGLAEVVQLECKQYSAGGDDLWPLHSFALRQETHFTSALLRRPGRISKNARHRQYRTDKHCQARITKNIILLNAVSRYGRLPGISTKPKADGLKTAKLTSKRVLR